ncbi:MAG: undecaprenyl-diphosphate phosphatase [Candidatus Omnitrophica bacterium]|nr:undecaprenyl-diphosphate phosphatase [Candidatus Omnitrophota bacterium]MCA9436050.1 undecaprenyl-diphosphate phosphatase [Candidatus Omnitrophota bacterium]MCA9440469.1 undecaprenyl-diphosphate phosphatase [Candidatus Omnitrophota bacterium]MCB9768766.1 undecaprenyl-diphosphate phosphatase [Candidatus Omnitrophota bacterium]
MTDLLISAYLGFIQGLTEFLPVSSSGHLALSRILLEKFGVSTGGLGHDLFMEVLLHVGTLLVVIGYYRREIGQFLNEWTGLGSAPSTTVPAGVCKSWTLYIIVTTLVTAGLAIPMKDQIEAAFHSLNAVGIGLLFTAFILFVSSWASKNRPESAAKSMNLGFAIIIGLAQFIAVSPGVSRSGTTIAVALLLGLKREQAVTYSFLISIPAILGAALLTAKDVDHVHLLGPMIGMVVAMIFGWLALVLLVRLVLQGKLWGFSVYCLIVGSLALLLGWFS